MWARHYNTDKSGTAKIGGCLEKLGFPHFSPMRVAARPQLSGGPNGRYDARRTMPQSVACLPAIENCSPYCICQDPQKDFLTNWRAPEVARVNTLSNCVKNRTRGAPATNAEDQRARLGKGKMVTSAWPFLHRPLALTCHRRSGDLEVSIAT
ncbi:hypothetical protein ElyMa_005911700 [Elysia marginata]|uniref:Uncharacterized protein n=1 Tax=Elysia marginata TaxID=1093978 RepID=A0AAV4G5G4_9GAST|nr:hypothetical protein ElyMa_005911700 [Elysia marginata]